MAKARNAKMMAKAIAPPFFFTLEEEVGLESTSDLTELVPASESLLSSVIMDNSLVNMDNSSDRVVVVVGEVVDGAVVLVVEEAVVGDVVVVLGEDVILCTLVVVVLVVEVVDEDVETVELLANTASVTAVVVVVVVVVEVAVVEDTSVREPAALASLLQLDSSDASSQSGVPSQTQEFGIQLPSPQ